MNVFEGHPNAAHEAFRDRREVNGIAMQVLRGADREVQSLKRECRAAVEFP
jgi:hypothetical protein